MSTNATGYDDSRKEYVAYCEGKCAKVRATTCAGAASVVGFHFASSIVLPVDHWELPETRLLTANGTIGVTWPTEEEVDLGLVARSLGGICRWTGQTKRHYSVAEHSLLMMIMVPDELGLSALLHDAGEWLLNDITPPIKRAYVTNPGVERRIVAAISGALGVDLDLDNPLIKKADQKLAVAEAVDLVGVDLDAAQILLGHKYEPVEWLNLDREAATKLWLKEVKRRVDTDRR